MLGAMEAGRLTRPISRRALWLAALGVLLAAPVGTAIALLVWIRSYTPLHISGGGVSGPATEVPADDSSFVDWRIFLVRPGVQGLQFYLDEDGRWPVTLDGIEIGPSPQGDHFVPRTVQLQTSDGKLEPPMSEGWTQRVGRHDLTPLYVRFNVDCRGLPHGSFTPVTQLRVHYRYLRFFKRTQTIPLYDHLTLACP